MSTNTEDPLSIGILGAARIAKKNSRAISHPATSCRVVSIASRSREKGEGLVSEIFLEPRGICREHGSSQFRPGSHQERINIPTTTPVVYGSYDALISDESCEALYIPLPTKLHYNYVISALQSGKHVMLEKPVRSRGGYIS